MRTRLLAIALACTVVAASEARAQHFGVMESAEIIAPNNLKFAAYPISIMSDGPVDDQLGVALRGGYGFTNFLDVEIGVGVFDEANIFGGDLELSLVKSRPAPGSVDLSARGGGYVIRGDDVLDASALNLTGILSVRATQQLDLNAALNFNRLYFDTDLPFVEDYNTLHVVPGVEYRVRRNLDLLAEFGVGLDDRAQNYFSAGVAVYFQ